MTNEFAGISRVLPSGGARETISVAITVPAPGRFSITIDGPWARPISSASTRPRTSMAPPDGRGTTTLMVRASCADAAKTEMKMIEMRSGATERASRRN